MNLMETIAYQNIGNFKETVNHYGGPVGLAGKLIGLGVDEMDEGLPGWAWFGLGLLAGGVVTFKLHDRIARVVRD